MFIFKPLKTFFNLFNCPNFPNTHISMVTLFILFKRMIFFMSRFCVFIRRMNVPGGRFQRLMAEENLNSGRIGALFGQIRGKAVSQRVSTRWHIDAEKFTVFLNFHLKIVGRNMFALISSIASSFWNKEKRGVIHAFFNIIVYVAFSTLCEIHKALFLTLTQYKNPARFIYLSSFNTNEFRDTHTGRKQHLQRSAIT